MFDRDTAKTTARAKGLTPRDLAPLVGVSERQLWRYEAGKSEPPFSVAARMARVLGLALDDLYVHEPEANEPAKGRGFDTAALVPQENEAGAAYHSSGSGLARNGG